MSSCTAMTGANGTPGLPAADGLDILRGRQHFMSDARIATEAALHSQGVALGDTITAGGMIAKGN